MRPCAAVYKDVYESGNPVVYESWCPVHASFIVFLHVAFGALPG